MICPPSSWNLVSLTSNSDHLLCTQTSRLEREMKGNEELPHCLIMFSTFLQPAEASRIWTVCKSCLWWYIHGYPSIELWILLVWGHEPNYKSTWSRIDSPVSQSRQFSALILFYSSHTRLQQTDMKTHNYGKLYILSLFLFLYVRSSTSARHSSLSLFLLSYLSILVLSSQSSCSEILGVEGWRTRGGNEVLVRPSRCRSTSRTENGFLHAKKVVMTYYCPIVFLQSSSPYTSSTNNWNIPKNARSTQELTTVN